MVRPHHEAHEGHEECKCKFLNPRNRLVLRSEIYPLVFGCGFAQAEKE